MGTCVAKTSKPNDHNTEKKNTLDKFDLFDDNNHETKHYRRTRRENTN